MRQLLLLATSLVLAAPATSFAQQNDPTLTLLQRLADAPGPPGFEDPVRAIVVEQMKPLTSAPLRYDGMGSVVAQLGSSGPKVMVDAHMDELGGMVRRIAPNGMLTMQMLGGWLDQALPDQRWIIIGSKGPVIAVTGIRDIHVVPEDERGKVLPSAPRSSPVIRSSSISARATRPKPRPWVSAPAIPSCPTPRSRCSMAHRTISAKPGTIASA